MLPNHQPEYCRKNRHRIDLTLKARDGDEGRTQHDQRRSEDTNALCGPPPSEIHVDRQCYADIRKYRTQVREIAEGERRDVP